MPDLIVRATALSRESFAPFGDVIDVEGRDWRWINGGTCRRYDDLARIDVSEGGGRPLLSVFEATPCVLPVEIRTLERHPVSSQAFVPLDMRPFLIVVGADDLCATAVRAYVSSGRQGVNYRRNTWHHPLIALEQVSRFLVVDRGGPGENCEELALDTVVRVIVPERTS